MSEEISTLAILESALDQRRDSRRGTPDAIKTLLKYADDRWPFVQFLKAVGYTGSQEGRWQTANAALNGIRLTVGLSLSLASPTSHRNIMAALILIRELCPHCRAPQIILTDILDDASDSTLHPVRCIKCAEIFLFEAPERTVIEGPYSE